jgi:hypothetical protein
MGVKIGLTLTEEHRLKVLENWVLRKLFGPKRDEVTREWRRLRSEKLCDLYSQYIVRVIRLRKMRWPGNIVRMGEGRRI